MDEHDTSSVSFATARKNQYKPLPPLELIEPTIRRYFKLGYTDKKILDEIHKHLEREVPGVYGIKMTKFREIRKTLNLLSTRAQKHTVSLIKDDIEAIRQEFPTAGYRSMKSHLLLTTGKRVSHKVIREHAHLYDPEGNQQRKARKLKRRRFWAAGVNDIWTVDQHDKFKRFGLWLHICVEPFSGVIVWLRVWWTNKNPRLIFGYYIDAVRKLGFIPLITQSDPGSENFALASGHTALRHHHDPSLHGTRQHRTTTGHMNVKPEIEWRVLRQGWSVGFENELERGVREDWYEPANTLHALVFRFLWIPYIQRKLDEWVIHHNTFRKRHDRHKILPQGMPLQIFENPQQFGALDFRIPVMMEYVDKVEAYFAPSNHPVFELVPPAFMEQANAIVTQMPYPASPSLQEMWPLFQSIVFCFQRHVSMEQSLSLWEHSLRPQENDQEFQMEDLGDLGFGENSPLDEEGNIYLGGLSQPLQVYSKAACNEKGGEDHEVEPLFLDDFFSDDSEEKDDEGQPFNW